MYVTSWSKSKLLIKTIDHRYKLIFFSLRCSLILATHCTKLSLSFYIFKSLPCLVSLESTFHINVTHLSFCWLDFFCIDLMMFVMIMEKNNKVKLNIGRILTSFGRECFASVRYRLNLKVWSKQNWSCHLSLCQSSYSYIILCTVPLRGQKVWYYSKICICINNLPVFLQC